MPPFDSADAWTKQQFFDFGFGVADYGSDCEAMYNDADGRYYVVLNNSSFDSVVMVSSDDPTATQWSDEGAVASAGDTPYSEVNDPFILEANGTYYVGCSAGGTNDKTAQNIYIASAPSVTGSYTLESTGITAGGEPYKSNGVSEPVISYDPINDRFILTYTGYDGSKLSINVATSPDGTAGSFSDLAENPVLETGPDGVSSVEDQSNFFENGLYAMYYNEQDVGDPPVSKAISTDLVNWTNVDDNEIILPNDPEDRSGCYAPTVARGPDGTVHMWYAGFAEPSEPEDFYRAYAQGDVEQLGGRTKHYDGSSWVTRPVWWYNGSSWERANDVKQYDGSSWIGTPPTSASATAPPSGINQVTTVDDFEDNDISEYTGSTADYSVDSNTPVQSGTYSLKHDTTADSEMVSTSGLNAYPSSGDVFETDVYVSSSTYAGVLFGVQDADNLYLAQVQGGNQEIRIWVKSGGSYTSLDRAQNLTFGTGKWLTAKIDWTASGFTLTLVENGSSVGSVTTSDTTYTSGGVGFRGGTGEAYDNLRIS